jgi:hypothetical protein
MTLISGMFVATNLPPGRSCKSPLLRSGDLFGFTEVTSNFGPDVFSVCDCASPMDATSVIPIHFRFMAFLPFGHASVKTARILRRAVNLGYASHPFDLPSKQDRKAPGNKQKISIQFSGD